MGRVFKQAVVWIKELARQKKEKLSLWTAIVQPSGAYKSGRGNQKFRLERIVSDMLNLRAEKFN